MTVWQASSFGRGCGFGLPPRPGQSLLPKRATHYGSHAAVDVVYEKEPARIVVITVLRITRKEEEGTMQPDFLPSLDLSVDEKTGIVRAYLRVRKGEVADTREVSEGPLLPIMMPGACCSASNCLPRVNSESSIRFPRMNLSPSSGSSVEAHPVNWFLADLSYQSESATISPVPLLARAGIIGAAP